MTEKRTMRAQRKRHSEAADWVFRNREATQSADDKALFQKWLERDPANQHAYTMAEKLLGDAQTAIKAGPALREHKIKPINRTKPVAGTILSLALAGSLFVLLDGPLYLEADLMSGAHDMPNMTLDDGSLIQINASSAVAFHYDDKQRTIRLLKGQAFFQVAKDSERPFVVEAGNARVTALGTAFDIRLGSDDTDVTVTESTVLLETTDKTQQATRVTQGQQAVLNRNSGKADIRDVDELTALAWKRGQLAVDNAPLSLVIEEMNRHFSGRIMLIGNNLSNRRVSGTIAVADTDAALSFIEQALQVKITRAGLLIMIHS